MANGNVGIGRLSILQMDLQDHDLVEKVMKQKSSLDVGAPEAPDTRLAARSQPSITITADHFKFGKPNRKPADSRMRHKRNDR